MLTQGEEEPKHRQSTLTHDDGTMLTQGEHEREHRQARTLLQGSAASSAQAPCPGAAVQPVKPATEDLEF